MGLDSIINVAIDAQTTQPTRTGFGIPLVAGFHTKNTDRIRYYTQLTELLTDGFVTTDAIYKACKAVFAQNPRPTKLAVGRFTVASVMTVDFTPVVVNLQAYTVIINGVTHTFTADGTATAAEIVDGLVALINAGGAAAAVTASNVANVLHIISDVAGNLFDWEVDAYSKWTTIKDNTADTSGIAAQLAAISVVDDTWYGLVLVPRGALEIIAAAGYIETVKKVFIAGSGDSGCVDGASNTDVAFLVMTAAYARSAVMFHRKPHEYAAAAWLAGRLPLDPGSYTFDFKTLAGITADVLTATEVTALVNKKGNYYQSIAGVNVAQEGKTGSGEYIDVTIFIDWLRASIQEDIFTILLNLPKIPFTDAGIGLIEGAIRSVLRQGVVAGGLADDDVLDVQVPLAKDVSSADRAARKLTGVRFQGRLAGAIHSLVINGTVTV